MGIENNTNIYAHYTLLENHNIEYTTFKNSNITILVPNVLLDKVYASGNKLYFNNIKSNEFIKVNLNSNLDNVEYI